MDFSDQVESSEEHLRNLTSQVSTIRSSAKDRSRKDDARVANAEASKCLRELDRCVSNIAAMARSAAPSLRRTMLEAVEKLRTLIASGRQDLTRANEELSRAELLAGASSAAERAEADSREKMVRTTESATR